MIRRIRLVYHYCLPVNNFSHTKSKSTMISLQSIDIKICLMQLNATKNSSMIQFNRWTCVVVIVLSILAVQLPSWRLYRKRVQKSFYLVFSLTLTGQIGTCWPNFRLQKRDSPSRFDPLMLTGHQWTYSEVYSLFPHTVCRGWYHNVSMLSAAGDVLTTGQRRQHRVMKSFDVITWVSSLFKSDMIFFLVFGMCN